MCQTESNLNLAQHPVSNSVQWQWLQRNSAVVIIAELTPKESFFLIRIMAGRFTSRKRRADVPSNVLGFAKSCLVL